VKNNAEDRKDGVDEHAHSLKQIRMTEEEKSFLVDYRKLEDLEREKGIKFFECIGDPPASDEFIEGIQVKRQNFILNKEEDMRINDVGRFSTEINADKVVIPTKLEMTSQPVWDVYENSQFAMRKRLVDIFLKVANKLIT
jgi:hypothetical protein